MKPIGMNVLQPKRHVDPRMQPFINLAWVCEMREIRADGTLGERRDFPWDTVNADLYPTTKPIAVYVGAYKTGFHWVEWDGTQDGVTAKDTPQSTGWAAQSLTPNLAGYRVDDIPTGKPVILLEIAPGVSNLRIWHQGEDITQTFRQEFIDELTGYDTLRMMDAAAINDSPTGTWSERTTPQSLSAYTSNGMALEHMIELCNVTHANLWVCVPDMATDEYIRNMAQLIHARLDPDLKVYVEYSNEVWNGQFRQHNRVLALALANPATAGGTEHDRRMKQHGIMTANAVRIFSELFYLLGRDQGRAIGIMGAWHATPTMVKKSLDQPYMGGTVAEWIDKIAVAPYAGHKAPLGMTDPEAVAWVRQDMHARREDTLRSINIAAEYGMELTAYEWNHHLDQYSGDFLTGPAMTVVLKELIEHWRSVGGGLAMFYTMGGARKKWSAYRDTAVIQMVLAINEGGADMPIESQITVVINGTAGGLTASATVLADIPEPPPPGPEFRMSANGLKPTVADDGSFEVNAGSLVTVNTTGEQPVFELGAELPEGWEHDYDDVTTVFRFRRAA